PAAGSVTTAQDEELADLREREAAVLGLFDEAQAPGGILVVKPVPARALARRLHQTLALIITQRVAADARGGSELADGEHGAVSTVSLNLGGKTKVKPGQAGDPRLRLRRASQSGSPQDGFIDAATGTTCGQLALDHHRGNRTDAEALGTLGHLDLSHVVNDHLAREASGAPDELDRLVAGRASGAEHFDLSRSGHRLGPIYLGAVLAERSPM